MHNKTHIIYQSDNFQYRGKGILVKTIKIIQRLLRKEWK